MLFGFMNYTCMRVLLALARKMQAKAFRRSRDAGFAFVPLQSLEPLLVVSKQS